MPLVEKEVIAPGTYWYVEEKTGLPRKLDVTPELTKYWLDQGNKMLGTGLTVPVPCEHDFKAHPMTPRDQILNNAGWAKEYRLKDYLDPVTKKEVKDALFAVLDVEDEEVYKKLPSTIKWTSPWINSFTDGNGKKWNNVISHIALTTRPRITKQNPFPSVAAALSMAAGIPLKSDEPHSEDGFCLSRAQQLREWVTHDGKHELRPKYPVAFSLTSGIALGDAPPFAKKKEGTKKPESEGGKTDDNPTPNEEEESSEGATPGAGGAGGDDSDANALESAEQANEFADKKGDVGLEEVLCDLLSALGVHCEKSGDEKMFKRNLYTAAMMKVHELTNRNLNPDQPKPGEIGKQPLPQAGSPTKPNPLVQQEQQPMYMSLEEINKLPDPTKSVALAMYAENQKLRGDLEANGKVTQNLLNGRLKEATDKRAVRIAVLSKANSAVKADLEKMVADPNMALSLGEGGVVIDPMAQVLGMLEKTLSSMPNIPKLLTSDSAQLSVHAQPTDDSVMSQERIDELADTMSRYMGYPAQKAS